MTLGEVALHCGDKHQHLSISGKPMQGQLLRARITCSHVFISKCSKV